MIKITHQDEIKDALAGMSVEEKVGQLCSPILQSSDIPDHIRRFVQEIGVGVIRYCINAEYDNSSHVVGRPNRYLSPAENAGLLNKLQESACGRTNGIPLIISIDQEGGTRNDLNRYGALVFGSHLALGAANDPDLTEQIAYLGGKQMKSLGINMVQAPITDVISYAGRTTIKAASFGEDPASVTRQAKAMMSGYQQAGLAVMIKHFPGYGATGVDAHKGTARVFKSREELDAHDNIPIRELLRAGADGVMTGHVIIDSLDASLTPATLSSPIITGLLRREWGYEGIVETDAMRMKAIQEKYGTGKASVMAIQAGCDLVLLRGDELHFMDGYEALVKAVRSGEIPAERLDQSLTRILKLKLKLGLFEKHLSDPAAAGTAFADGQARAAARSLAEKSVALIRDRSNQLPLKIDGKKLAVISPEPSKIAGADDDIQCPEMFSKAISEIKPGTYSILLSDEFADHETANAIGLAKNADIIIIGTANALNSDKQRKLFKQLMKLGKPVVMVALESPFDAMEFPEADTVLCTFGFAADAMKVAAETIFGKLQPAGRLPVSLKI